MTDRARLVASSSGPISLGLPGKFGQVQNTRKAIEKLSGIGQVAVELIAKRS